MVQFDDVPGDDTVLVTPGHGRSEADLRAGLEAKLTQRGRSPLQAKVGVESATLAETWFHPDYGFGHDCSLHQDVPQDLWAPGCGTFKPVTVAARVSGAPQVQRAAPPRGAGNGGGAAPAAPAH